MAKVETNIRTNHSELFEGTTHDNLGFRGRKGQKVQPNFATNIAMEFLLPYLLHPRVVLGDLTRWHELWQWGLASPNSCQRVTGKRLSAGCPARSPSTTVSPYEFPHQTDKKTIKSEVSKRGWRTEEVGARKSSICQRFRPLFCALFPMHP